MKVSQITIVLFFTLINFYLTGCNSDPCETVICANGANCVEGQCICPLGYTGLLCDSIDPSQLQVHLNGGMTPFDLINAGIPIDSLYGNLYMGGSIFYIDTANGTGMVSRSAGQASWNCIGIVIPGLTDVATSDPSIVGARVGDGEANTDAIIAGCTVQGNAALVCRDLGPEWFLPSLGELELVTALHSTPIVGGGGGGGGGGFPFYWSSTQYNPGVAWKGQYGYSTQDSKGENESVIAVRTF